MVTMEDRTYSLVTEPKRLGPKSRLFLVFLSTLVALFLALCFLSGKEARALGIGDEPLAGSAAPVNEPAAGPPSAPAPSSTLTSEPVDASTPEAPQHSTAAAPTSAPADVESAVTAPADGPSGTPVAPEAIDAVSASEPVAQQVQQSAQPLVEPLQQAVSPTVESARLTSEPLVELVGSTTEPVIESARLALEPATESVLGTVEPVGETVEGAIEPVLETAEPVAEPVQQVLGPLTDTVGQTIDPVLGAVEPVVEPVQQKIEPTIEPVLRGTEPLLEPVWQTAQPVTNPVQQDAVQPDAATVPGTTNPTIGPAHDAVAMPQASGASFSEAWDTRAVGEPSSQIAHLSTSRAEVPSVARDLQGTLSNPGSVFAADRGGSEAPGSAVAQRPSASIDVSAVLSKPFGGYLLGAFSPTLDRVEAAASAPGESSLPLLPAGGAAGGGASSSSGAGSGIGFFAFLAVLSILLLGGRFSWSSLEFLRPSSFLSLAVERPG